MSNSFGYIDIILLGMIAGFIILRLRSILGRKTGHEEKMQPRFVKGNFDLSTGSGFHLILMQSQVHGLDTACTM